MLSLVLAKNRIEEHAWIDRLTHALTNIILFPLKELIKLTLSLTEKILKLINS